jgi:hypothetical protein
MDNIDTQHLGQLLIHLIRKLAAGNGRVYRFSGNNPIEFGNLGNGALDGRVFMTMLFFLYCKFCLNL